MVGVRGMAFVIDEPEAAGGANEGPTPVEYLLGALAGCMSITARAAAKELGIQIFSLGIGIEGDLDPARFLGQPTQSRSGYREIRAVITADTSADAETRQRWLRMIEARCPVGDNLQNPTPVKITMS